jgi:hypothetical protein
MSYLIPLRLQGKRADVDALLTDLRRAFFQVDRPGCILWTPPSWADGSDEIADEFAIEVLAASNRAAAVKRLEQALAAIDPQKTVLEINRGYKALS